jgi:hypothetical protein
MVQEVEEQALEEEFLWILQTTRLTQDRLIPMVVWERIMAVLELPSSITQVWI